MIQQVQRVVRSKNVTFTALYRDSPAFCKLFRKPEDALSEVRGYNLIAEHYPVPRLLDVIQRKSGSMVLVYELAHDAGGELVLLQDVIDKCDMQSDIGALMALTNDLHRLVEQKMRETARLMTASELRGEFYWGRTAIGGQLDRFYKEPHEGGEVGSMQFDPTRTYRFTTPELSAEVCLSSLAEVLRTAFRSDEQVVACLTQGDLTEMNVSFPLRILDPGNGGWNCMLGDMAIYAWSVYAVGTFLGHRYNRVAYRTYCRQSEIPLHVPVVVKDRVSMRDGEFRFAVTFDCGEARRYVLRSYRDQIAAPLGYANIGPHWEDELRRFLALRILGVFNVCKMCEDDFLFCMAKLLELQSEKFTFSSFFDL